MPNELAEARDHSPPGVVAIKMHLSDQIQQLAAACPQHFRPEKMIQVVGIIAHRTPKLQECDKNTIMVAVMQSASLGLDLNPALPEGYLIPRYNKDLYGKNKGGMECTFMPGYQGLAKLARNAGNLRYIQAKIVHAKDSFRTWNDPESKLEHSEYRDGEPGPMTWVYAVAKLQTGEVIFECMSRREIDNIKNRSESVKKGDFSPWTTDYEEMAKKTAIKRLCKVLPRSAELAQALDIDNTDYGQPAIEKPQNDSGYAKGQMASPEQTETYLTAMTGYVNKRNLEWLDKWSTHGGIPDGLEELCHCNRADNHLLKWCVERGLVNAPKEDYENGPKHRSIGRYTAIVYHRSRKDREALSQELRRYIDELTERQTAKLKAKNPALFGEEIPADECEVDDGFDGVTEIESADNSEVWPPGKE